MSICWLALVGTCVVGLGLILRFDVRRHAARQRFERDAEAAWREVEAMLDALPAGPTAATLDERSNRSAPRASCRPSHPEKR